MTGTPSGSGYYLDSYTGSDDDKLDRAIADQKGSGGRSNYAPIILPSRTINPNKPRKTYSGLHVIGEYRSGQENPEIAGGQYVGPRIVLGNGIGSADQSWWSSPGGPMYDIFMADFSVQGNSGHAQHQFMDVVTGTLYACEFSSLSFNMMKGVFGTRDRKCLVTQVIFSGTWTVNNLWDTQFCLGGSDSMLWQSGYCNIGPSNSPAQKGAEGRYMIWLDSLGKSSMGYVYASALNGWRGIRIGGNNATKVSVFGSTFEGYKPSGENLVAPGSVVRVDNGTVVLNGVSIGQGMQHPGGDRALVDVRGGTVTLAGCDFYGSGQSVALSGGHLSAIGCGGNPTAKVTGGTFWSDGTMKQV